LSFSYTGSLQIQDSLIDDLVDLCRQLNCNDLIEIITSQKLRLENIIAENIVAIKSEDQNEKPRLNVEFEESSNVETIFFDENEFEGTEDIIKEEYLNEAQFETKHIKYENQNQTMYHVIEEVTEAQEFNTNVSCTVSQQESKRPGKEFPLIRKSMKPSISFPAQQINLSQLKEEQERFKKRLQDAINLCKNGKSVKKAAKLFSVSEDAISRSLRGFKLT
jgi:hypothetical protein